MMEMRKGSPGSFSLRSPENESRDRLAAQLTSQTPMRLIPQMHLDDAAAVARAAGGDEDAFRVLVERHSRSVYRLAFRMTRQAADAEDVVQDTFEIGRTSGRERG